MGLSSIIFRLQAFLLLHPFTSASKLRILEDGIQTFKKGRNPYIRNIHIYIYMFYIKIDMYINEIKPLRNSVDTHPRRCITSTQVKLWPDSYAPRSVVPVRDLRRGIGPSDHHWSLVKGCRWWRWVTLPKNWRLWERTRVPIVQQFGPYLLATGGIWCNSCKGKFEGYSLIIRWSSWLFDRYKHASPLKNGGKGTHDPFLWLVFGPFSGAMLDSFRVEGRVGEKRWLGEMEKWVLLEHGI